MKTAACLLACAVAGLPALAAPARSGLVRVGTPIPSWVSAIEVDVGRPVEPEEATDGVAYLLVDRQVRVHGAGRSSFVRHVRRIVTAAGLEAASQFVVSFDPEYQRLQLHAVRVFREGRWSSRLDASQVQVLQREPELESQIYDGRLQAQQFLADLRVGDVVETTHTVDGANPVFRGMAAENFTLEWGVHVGTLHQRLLWPRDRPLHLRNHLTHALPQRREVGPIVELVWEALDVPPAPSVSGAPADYPTQAWVQASEAETWGQVAAWARGVFDVAETLPPEVRSKLDEWRGAGPDSAAWALAATRFVQDEIRYVGIEMGEGSHQPSPPALVVARRFGDCKDKAVLLAAMLRYLGLEAAPALVNSGSGAALDTWHPSPHAFNHAIVRLRLGGREHWIDGTLGAQGGSLASLHLPDYRRALVLEPGTSGLVAIPHRAAESPTTVVREKFDVRSLDGAVGYEVETRYEGGDADATRRAFQRDGKAEVARSYLEFYEAGFPGIRMTEPLGYEDDRQRNVVVVRERYTIPAFLGPGRSAGTRQRRLHASSVAGEIGDPGRDRRSVPLAVGFPRRVRHVIDLALPEPWQYPPASEKVAGPATGLTYRLSQVDGGVRLEYDYVATRRFVAVDQLPAHRKATARMRELVEQTLEFPPAGGSAGGEPRAGQSPVNWALASTLATVLPLLVLGGIRTWRWDLPAAREDAVAEGAPCGFGGWMILVLLYLLTATVQLLTGAEDWLVRPLGPDWYALTSPESASYHAFWAPLLVVGLIGNLVCLALLGVAWLALFRRRRTFPRLFAALVVSVALVALAQAFLVQPIPGSDEFVGRLALRVLLALQGAIGSGYLFASWRARATFVA
ncbi:MAG: DUF3857 domain-containing protein [Vicinamibacteria bacterium]|nr:DUF3857 domain-containing protein [Vicinamibacteria bacterium]